MTTIAPPPMPHLAGRAEVLEALGWTGADAEWLALVCLHSGVFTRSQYRHRFDVGHTTAHRFVRRLVDADVAADHLLPGTRQGTRLCHVFGRGLYRALEVEHIRHRRFGTEGVIFRRLLSLDLVMERPDLPWLATEQEKVARFAELGIEAEVLPQRVYRGGTRGASRRYFHLKLPVAVDGSRAVFVYTDPGAGTTHQLARQLSYWRELHRPLWARLRGSGLAVHLAVAVRTWAALERYETALAQWVAGPEVKPLDVEDRQLLEEILAAVKAGDREALDGWGGFMEASRIVGELRRREAERSSGASGQIDSFETHLAERISDDTYGA